MTSLQISLPVRILSIGLMILVPLVMIWAIWVRIVAPLAEKITVKDGQSTVWKWLGLWLLGLGYLAALFCFFYFKKQPAAAASLFVLTSLGSAWTFRRDRQQQEKIKAIENRRKRP